MQARETIRRRPVSVGPETTVTATAEAVNQATVGAVVVVEDGKPVGIVTDRDLVVRGLARRLAPDARVDSVMSTEVVTLGADADVRDALGLLRTHPIRRIPLVEADGTLAGVISADDLFINLLSDLEAVVTPVMGETFFGHAEPQVPATT